MGRPRFLSDSGKITDNVSFREGTLFRTLIAKTDSPLWHRRRPPTEGLNFDQNPSNHQKLLAKIGGILEARWASGISLKIRKIAREVSSRAVEPSSRSRVPHFGTASAHSPEGLNFD